MIAFFQLSLVNNQTYRFHQNRYHYADFGRLNSYHKCFKNELLNPYVLDKTLKIYKGYFHIVYVSSYYKIRFFQVFVDKY